MEAQRDETLIMPKDAPGTGLLKRELYFPTYIYYKDLPDGAEINAQIKPHIYAWRESDQEGIVRSNVKIAGAWHSPVDMNRRAEFQPLVERISTTANEIFRDLGYSEEWEAVVDNMWANISPRFGYNRNHVHPNALWSGVYYVQAPPNAGRIFFTEPRPQAMVLTPVYGPDRVNRPEAWSEVYYQPIEGRMILFPSWLLHEVEPNASDLQGPAGDRISVSVNIVQRRRSAAGR